MKILALGLLLFIGIHLLPSFSAAHQRLINRLGRLQYRGMFSVLALTGLSLIILGYRQAELIPVWTPPAWGQNVTYILMPFVFILFAAAYLPGNCKRYTRHPMLWGVTLWSIAHLLARGDLAALLLFAGLGLFALFDMASANRRGARLASAAVPVSRDIIVIAAGVVAYLLVLIIHPVSSPLRML